MTFSEEKLKRRWFNPLTWKAKWEYRAIDNPAGEIVFTFPHKLDKNEIDLITMWIEKQPSGKGKIKYKKNHSLGNVEYYFLKREKWEEDEK
jgi:hypothetical protein